MWTWLNRNFNYSGSRADCRQQWQHDAVSGRYLAIGFYKVAGVRPVMAANRCGVIYRVNLSTFNEFILGKMHQLYSTSIVDFGSMLCARKHKFMCINRNRINQLSPFMSIRRSFGIGVCEPFISHQTRCEIYLQIEHGHRTMSPLSHRGRMPQTNKRRKIAIGKNWFHRLFNRSADHVEVDSAVGILRQIKTSSESTNRQMIS